MGRKRNNENADLPPHVHRKNGAYYYVRDPKFTISETTWTRLADIGAPMGDVYLAIARLIGAKVGDAKPATAADKMTMADLMERALPFVCKGQHGALSPNTKRGYVCQSNALKAIFEKEGHTVAEFKHKHVVALRREFVDQPGTFNQRLAVLRMSLAWAKDEEIIDSNPCEDVDALPKRKRSETLNDAQFDAIYAHCKPRERVLMDLCLFTGQRICDVLAIRESDLTETGVMFTPSKTKRYGKRICVEWSPELRDAVARARALKSGAVRFTNAADYAAAVGAVPMADGYLITGPRKRHDRLSYSTVREQWAVACEKAGLTSKHIHDMRSMALGAVEEVHGLAGANALGIHSTMGQTADYVRTHRVKVVKGPTRRAPVAA